MLLTNSIGDLEVVLLQLQRPPSEFAIRCPDLCEPTESVVVCNNFEVPPKRPNNREAPLDSDRVGKGFESQERGK